MTSANLADLPQIPRGTRTTAQTPTQFSNHVTAACPSKQVGIRRIREKTSRSHRAVHQIPAAATVEMRPRDNRRPAASGTATSPRES